MPTASSASPFRLSGIIEQALSPVIAPAVTPVIAPLMEHLLALRRLERTYAALPRDLPAAEFARRSLDLLGLQFEFDPQQLAHIPAAGPAVVVANHPFGGLEGVCMASLLGRLRRDARLLGNRVLARIPELAPLVIPVDNLGGAVAVRGNERAMRLALRHLRRGGLLMIFPAGAVSHLQPGAGVITDPQWHTSAARLARLAGAPLVPAWFDGANSAAFQLAGLLHPRLRTALLPREMFNKQRQRLALRIGAPVEPRALARLGDDSGVTRHLRLWSYALALQAPRPRTSAPTLRTPVPIAAAVPAAYVQAEVGALPDEQLLLRHGDLCVYHAGAAQAPWLLQELGRLREQAFRAVGEGTGRAADIDLFDDYYQHLFLWNAAAGAVVGGYRIGHVDRIRRLSGVRRLYTQTLFDYGEPLLALLGPSLELGRSFIRPEYQRGFAPLLLLWKGIAAYVARHPRYRTLFGPVSLSNSYTHTTRQLLVGWLRLHHGHALQGRLVRARQPFPPDRALAVLRADLLALPGMEALDALVAGIEPDGKGVPVLLRQYLNLGGRMLAFNVDAAFGDSIDCLVAVDLRRTEPRLLARLMGRVEAGAYLAAHGVTQRPR